MSEINKEVIESTKKESTHTQIHMHTHITAYCYLSQSRMTFERPWGRVKKEHRVFLRVEE